jgi:hypothetical protein
VSVEVVKQLEILKYVGRTLVYYNRNFLAIIENCETEAVNPLYIYIYIFKYTCTEWRIYFRFIVQFDAQQTIIVNLKLGRQAVSRMSFIYWWVCTTGAFVI